ncbi:MAG: family 78 glycoside hydrolase catalytic domain [Anaerolineae bacterium]|nr:family 78 glycoside hydrolase catalytic domain [Anaerolineae bacterium]
MDTKGEQFHDFPVSRKWRAMWIWMPGEPDVPNSFYLFRKELNLAQTAGLRLHIAAGTCYRLYINGQFVGRGVPQSQSFFQYYGTWGVEDYLAEGMNCIGIIVNYVGNLADTRGGLLLEVEDAAGGFVLASGPEWRVTPATAWTSKPFHFCRNQSPPYQEIFDARKMPQGWNEVGFADDDWRWAEVLHGCIADYPPMVAPWSCLLPCDIPPMTTDSMLPVAVTYTEECLDIVPLVRGEDLSISLSASGKPLVCARIEGEENLCTADGVTVLQCSAEYLDRSFDGGYNPCIVLDFGRVITAYLRVKLEGVAGGVLDIGYAERLLDGHFNNAIEGQLADRYVMRDGLQVFQPFTWKTFRYLKLRLRSCTEPVTIKSFKAMVTTYPYTERGGFVSADETLNRIFDSSRYMLRLHSNKFIMDTSWCEQFQCLGDVTSVTLGGIYACFGDTVLPGKFLRHAAANQGPIGMISNVSNRVNYPKQITIPDYALWWVMGLWNHYMYTGETRWIHTYYPHALRIFQAHLLYVNAYGLIEDMPYWPFIDEADVDKRGECAAYNAIFYGALDVLIQMAAMKHDVAMFARIEQVQESLHQYFQPHLYDPERGCFADARVDDVLSPKVSEHANMAAIYWGLCDMGLAQDIVHRFYEEKSIAYIEAQSFFNTVVLQALDRIGRFDLALDVIRARWNVQMTMCGATFVSEAWGMNRCWRSGEYNDFFCTHGYTCSAYPAEFLIRNLIGLKILEPGCRRVQLAPHIIGLDYMVTFPTYWGDIQVQMKEGSVRVIAPKNVEIVM